MPGNLRVGSFAWDLSFGIIRLGTVLAVSSLGNSLGAFRFAALRSSRLGVFARKVRFGSVGWQRSLGVVRLVTPICDMLLGSFRQFVWDHSLGNCRLGSFTCERLRAL